MEVGSDQGLRRVSSVPHGNYIVVQGYRFYLDRPTPHFSHVQTQPMGGIGSHHIVPCAQFAIQFYNHKNETDFEFTDFVSLDQKPAAGSVYHMIFMAKPRGTPDGHPPTTFEASVYEDMIQKTLKVLSCKKLLSAWW